MNSEKVKVSVGIYEMGEKEENLYKKWQSFLEKYKKDIEVIKEDWDNYYTIDFLCTLEIAKKIPEPKNEWYDA